MLSAMASKNRSNMLFWSSNRFFSAKTINYSRSSLCYRSGYKIRIRSNIYITIEDNDRVHDCKENDADGFAKVKCAE